MASTQLTEDLLLPEALGAGLALTHCKLSSPCSEEGRSLPILLEINLEDSVEKITWTKWKRYSVIGQR